MVSIREIMRIWKGKRGVTQEAATEFKERTEQLIEALVKLSNFEAQKRGDNARLRSSDVGLAYLSMLDLNKKVVEVNDDFGDWNAE
tara:strand:+ start:362 stop:619 length:258 start_codon:yes stop_codon:yes gene_type:complete